MWLENNASIIYEHRSGVIIRIMSDREKFLSFFKEVGIKSTNVDPEDVFLEMDEDVAWESALSVGQLWFLFNKDEEYLGLLNDETMQFESREK